MTGSLPPDVRDSESDPGARKGLDGCWRRASREIPGCDRSSEAVGDRA